MRGFICNSVKKFMGCALRVNKRTIFNICKHHFLNSNKQKHKYGKKFLRLGVSMGSSDNLLYKLSNLYSSLTIASDRPVQGLNDCKLKAIYFALI